MGYRGYSLTYEAPQTLQVVTDGEWIGCLENSTRNCTRTTMGVHVFYALHPKPFSQQLDALNFLGPM